jgi:trk system potassium uptake protein
MSKRIFIFGAGVFGIHLARRLMELGSEVVMAERDAELVRELSEKGFNIIEMDSDDEEALAESGVAEADAAVVAIGDNTQSSLLTTLSLKALRVPKIVARAADTKHAQALVRLGADRVLLPLRDTAWTLADRLLEDAISPRHPLAGEHQLAQILVTKKVAGDGVELRRLIDKHALRLVLTERMLQGKEPEVREAEPGYAPRLGDTLFLIGPRDALNRFERAIADQE